MVTEKDLEITKWKTEAKCSNQEVIEAREHYEALVEAIKNRNEQQAKHLMKNIPWDNATQHF